MMGVMTMETTDRELNAQQRAARVTRLFMLGGKYTTAEIAATTGLSYTGAWSMLCNISSEVPLRLDSMDGKWKFVGQYPKG